MSTTPPTPTESDDKAKLADKIADAFIQWKLPESVCADPCATKQGPGRYGTNLLSWVEAKQMAEQIILPLLETYACKRHHGGEAPGDTEQLKDDMLRSCTICGLTVDISKGHIDPDPDFTMRGRTRTKESNGR